MQFSFLGFSVKKIMEFELDVKDLAILRFFQDFMKSGKMNYEEVDGVKYYWISYKNISEEMPFLGLGKRTIMMRMLKLRDLGLLSHYTKKEGGTFSYYTLGDKFNDFLYTSENRSLINIEHESKNSSRKMNGQFINEINSNNRREIRGEGISCMNSIDGQDDSDMNSNIIGEMTEQATSNIDLNNNEKTILNNSNSKDNIISVNSKTEIINREEILDYSQHYNEPSEKSIQVNFEELIKNEEDKLTEVNKNSINYKEEDKSISEDPNQNNKDTLSKDMNRGSSSNDTTKTNLLNNLTTKNTNDLKSIKDKLEFILNYLNARANVNYRITNRRTVGLITARLREGFAVEDFKVVIDKKVSEWSGTDFEQYLNPFTLFGDKFELYLNQKVASKKNNVNGGVGNSQKGKSYKSDTRKLRFHNFTGREVDYDAIEKQLLGWD
ncbi:MAG: conserved phage C-terminal domain-containing protein [Clostridium sp.]|uniref:conserved phage C-terminal domain-containing protein n=1 Tax=Clostridium sp. TaxID=1506 RepID=UPI002912DF23|nr:conserved phage C-terminal domain-containing protein [Clostridium sp.]MDU5109603.1 conserved phage C-terminal domain-containing protein [Clostridium sp.]